MILGETEYTGYRDATRKLGFARGERPTGRDRGQALGKPGHQEG